MTDPIRIDPDQLFDDRSLCLALGVSEGTLARERKEGRLRCTRKGMRNFYFGRWVIDWLAGEPVAREEALACASS
jgi:hypothetical protein